MLVGRREQRGEADANANASASQDGEIYLRDSGVAFDEQQDDSIYEQARSSRSRRRGVISPPLSAPPSLPVPVEPSPSSPPLPPPPPTRHQSDLSPHNYNQREQKSYAELLGAIQRQQQAIVRLRAENAERARNEERLSSDLLDMTHRYLQAQAATDALEKRCKDAEAQMGRLALQEDRRETIKANYCRVSEDGRNRPRALHGEQDQLQNLVQARRKNAEGLGSDHTDTATISTGTVDSSEYISVNLSVTSGSSSSVSQETSPEEVLRLLKTINLQAQEVARACIASSTFRPGVRMMQVDNRMVVDLTEGIGCILVQILRSTDHSKNKTNVELGLRALLSYHVSKLIETWPFHAQNKRTNQEGNEEEPPIDDKEEFSEDVENTLKDIATILSLSGSPSHTSSLIRSHRNRIGSTLDVLFKTAEGLASQIKARRFDGTSPAEYSFLHARPGATYNKDLMQRHGTQHSMAIWKSATKKPVQVLCTREVGLARLYRAPTDASSSSSISRTTSRSGSSGRPSGKEIEVLSKVAVVFESDLDK